MKNPTSKKLVIITMILIVLISAILESFILINNVEIHIYEINFVSIILFSVLFQIFLFMQKRYLIYYILATITFIGYILSFIHIYTLIYDQTNFTFQMGFILYIISFILLIVSFFIKGDDNLKMKEIKRKKEFDEINQNENLICEFILGTKNIPYETMTVLKNDKQNKKISLVYKLNNVMYNCDILYSNIKNINFKARIITGEESTAKYNDELANSLLASALFSGNPVLRGAMNDYLNQSDISYKQIYTTIFEVTISFHQGSDFVLETVNDPKILINTIKKEIGIK